jgi:hypothetical protein
MRMSPGRLSVFGDAFMASFHNRVSLALADARLTVTPIETGFAPIAASCSIARSDARIQRLSDSTAI